jgi:hypothetical protein
MPTAIEVEVTVHPALLRPQPMDEFLRAGSETAARIVRTAGAGAMPGPSGKVNRIAKPGYGPLAGSLVEKYYFKPNDVMVAYVRTDVFYARFLEYGTRAGYPIPRDTLARRRGERPRAIMAIPLKGGTTIFRSQATHPGIRPRFWMRSAVEQATPDVVNAFEWQTRRWVAAVFRGGAP